MVNRIASADAMGDVRDAKPLEATAKQAQSAQRWTRLDLTRIIFNDNISYLSPAEQTLLTKQGRDFYPLGMTVNPEATKRLYQFMESDLRVVIQHSGTQSGQLGTDSRQQP